MKKQEFIRADGTLGFNNFPEDKEVYTSKFAKVGERKNLVVLKKTGKPVEIHNYFLGVKDKNGNELTLNISGGQKKNLDKTEDLTDKKIKFESYEHKKWGLLLGARVLKE